MDRNFIPEQAFKELEGTEYSRGELFRAIGSLRGKYLYLLGPETTRDDLYELAVRKGWIEKTPERKYLVNVKLPATDSPA